MMLFTRSLEMKESCLNGMAHFPSLLLVFDPVIQIMLHEGLKWQLLKKQMRLPSLDVFVIGAAAKAIATTVTNAMQTVQSILRFGCHRLNPENRTVGSLGIMGLYKGLEAKLLHSPHCCSHAPCG